MAISEIAGESNSITTSQLTLGISSLPAKKNNSVSITRNIAANEITETSIQDKKEIPYLVRKIVEAGEDIYSVNLIEPTLEDIYFTLTAGRKED